MTHVGVPVPDEVEAERQLRYYLWAALKTKPGATGVYCNVETEDSSVLSVTKTQEAVTVMKASITEERSLGAWRRGRIARRK